MKYWRFSNTRREFIVELIIQFLDSNHLLMPPLQISKFERGLLTFALLRSKVIVAILDAFVSVILWRWALVTVFEYFLEKKKRLEQKKFTTFIDSP